MERNVFITAEVDSAPYANHASTVTPRRRAPAATARHDLYRNIHAGLRLCMSDALAAVGRMDADDPADVAAVTLQMNELIVLFRSHLEKENTWIHPALEARQPGTTARIAHDHEDHVAAFSRLAADLLAMRNAPASRRSGAARALYRDLAAFVADNLLHMAAEESDHNAMLWSTHTDQELVDIERAIVVTRRRSADTLQPCERATDGASSASRDAARIDTPLKTNAACSASSSGGAGAALTIRKF